MWGYDQYLFSPSKNYFTDLLSLYFDIQLDNLNPDLLIYSCFGDEHHRYNCRKIFFTGENSVPEGVRRKIYPDYSECDISFSYFNTSEKNLYFPLWVLFVNWFQWELPLPLPSNPSYLVEIDYLFDKKVEVAEKLFDLKKECMFMNNNPVEDRIMLYKALLNFFDISSYGKLFNNTGGPVRGSEEEKHKILKKYRSTISYENTIRHGYNTEKIIQPYSEYCLSVYSGGLDEECFNKDALIVAQDYKCLDSLVDEVVDTVNDREKWIAKVCSPLFKGNKFPYGLQPLSVLEWLCEKLSL